MGIRTGAIKYTALTLTAAAVTVAGMGLASTASADGGPQPGPNRANPGTAAPTGPQRPAPGTAATAPSVDQPAGFRADLLVTAAQKLGISRAALQQELAGGHSLGQVSLSHGIAVADLKTTLVDAEDAALWKAVAAGTVTQAQANEQVSNFPGMVQRFLDRVVGGGQGRNFTMAARGGPGPAPATGPQNGPRPGSAAPFSGGNGRPAGR